jgi:hypothetical protein
MESQIEELRSFLTSLHTKHYNLTQRLKFLDSRIIELEKKYSSIRMAPRIEYEIREQLTTKIKYKKVLTPIKNQQEVDTCNTPFFLIWPYLDRNTIMSRIRKTQARRRTEDAIVFMPSQDDLDEIIPHGNRVRVQRETGYQWLYGNYLYPKFSCKGNK